MPKQEVQLYGEFGDYPNEKYAKFFNKFNEIDTLDISSWKPVNLLSYFCRKYEEQYKTKYKFKFNSPSPANCFEIFNIKKLGLQLSSKPTILKEYIDWVFKTKVVKAKRKLTSISFLANEYTLNEYKCLLLSQEVKFDRTTELPQNYKDIFKSVNVIVNNYGDLSFISKIEQTQEIIDAFNKITALGFDKNILSKIV